MLKPLDGKNDAERDDSKKRCEDSKIAMPYSREVDNLNGELDGYIGNDQNK